MSALPQIVRWRDWAGAGLEHAVLTETEGYIEVQSVVIAGPAEGAFAARYSLRLDPEWRVLELQASIVGTVSSVHLRRSAEGAWSDGGRPLPGLAGALDVDLSITPLTNTLPIRRAGLATGDSAEIVVAYVAFPELAVSAAPQRYTRLHGNRYRFESLDSGFVREITVDEHGLVIAYPGLFHRVM